MDAEHVRLRELAAALVAGIRLGSAGATLAAGARRCWARASRSARRAPAV